MKTDYYNLFNKLSQKKFGWRMRNGAFATGDKDFTGIFGTPYIFIPMGNKLQYLWSSIIKDLNYFIDGYTYEDNKRFNKLGEFDFDVDGTYGLHHLKDYQLEKVFKSILNTYDDYDMEEAIRSEGEIMFNCSKYMLINTKYDSELIIT